MIAALKQNIRLLFAPPVAFLSVLVVFAVGHAREQNCDLGDVPIAVKQLVADQFVEWRIWDRTDLTGEELKYWLQEKRRSSCPGLAMGYFSSKASLAYAISLVPKDSSREGWRLIVINRDSHGEYVTTVVVQRDDYTGSGFLWTAPPGTYSDINKPDKVTLRFDGFIYSGKGEILYYWKDGKYRSLILDD